jgi:hypothetical protein
MSRWISNKNMGRCYELAFRYILNEPNGRRAHLVHGALYGPLVCVEPYEHAWIWFYRKKLVWDVVHERYYTADEYRHKFHAVAHRVYTRKEACILAGVRHGHSGPWHQPPENEMILGTSRIWPGDQQ